MTNRYSPQGDLNDIKLGSAIDNWIDRNVSTMHGGCAWLWTYAIALLTGILMGALILAAIQGGEGSEFESSQLPHESEGIRSE